MENMMVSSLMNGMKNYRKGSFGTIVSTITTPKMNKGGKMGVAPNPLYNRVEKHTTYTNVRLGVSYENVIKAKMQRNGENPDNWQSQASSVGKYYNDFLLQSRKEENQFYLKIGLFPNTTTESTYFVDGRPATDEEMAIINAYTPEKTAPTKQTEAGIPEDEVYFIVSPKLDNVVSITQGEKTLYKRVELAAAM